MTIASARLCAGFLVCFALLGCGSRPSPAAPAAGHDPAAPATGQELPSPAARTDAETVRSVVPVDSPPAVPAGDSVPAIISKTFPTAGSVRRASKPFPHRVVQDSAGEVLGYEAFSDSAGVTARGYGGMVPLQVFFDSRGRPLRIYLLDNCETPAYMDLVLRSGLLDTLLVCDPVEPESVDAVTLATTSSHAIIYGAAGLASRVATEVATKPGSQVR
ncbi:FMN-binding protein [candidate division WOR-3 bacterium]|nr:FMN-binding protein [candidate division WOR-3 bacterium]